MSVRVARALRAWGWGAGCRRGASDFRLPPPGAVDVAELLRDATTAEEGPREAAARRPPGQCSVLLFPGQGSQVVGMGGGLLRYPRVRELYAAARSVLGYDLLELSLHGPQEALDRTAHCQPAIFVASLAAVEKLHHLQPAVIENCVAAAGFSVGEFAALVFAGAMEFSEERKGGRKRNSSWFTIVRTRTRDQTCNLGMCPDQEPNWGPFGYGMTLQPTAPHWPGLTWVFKVSKSTHVPAPHKEEREPRISSGPAGRPHAGTEVRQERAGRSLQQDLGRRRRQGRSSRQRRGAAHPPGVSRRSLDRSELKTLQRGRGIVADTLTQPVTCSATTVKALCPHLGQRGPKPPTGERITEFKP
ncbi:malonyl-CoA-acyl carrier protein transacylase, mitochondrial isoform 4-T4 [Glossophaga mutica]